VRIYVTSPFKRRIANEKGWHTETELYAWLSIRPKNGPDAILPENRWYRCRLNVGFDQVFSGRLSDT
jgi:hypothetical protein